MRRKNERGIKMQYVSALEEIVGSGNVSNSASVCQTYSYSCFLGSDWVTKPDLVVIARTPEQVSQILKLANPPASRDAQFIKDVLEPLGLMPGHPKAWASIGFLNSCALTIGFNRTMARIYDEASLSSENVPLTPTKWTAMPDLYRKFGNYGTDYRFRAGVAIVGLGANLPIDAVYLNTAIDGNGNRLDGSKKYRIKFLPGTEPPVRGFWSVTLYDDQGYLVPNSINRYAIRSSDQLVYEPDGSLVLYLQPNDPGPGHQANWLPTPPGKTFQLTLRAYWPDEKYYRESGYRPPLSRHNN